MSLVTVKANPLDPRKFKQLVRSKFDLTPIKDGSGNVLTKLTEKEKNAIVGFSSKNFVLTLRHGLILDESAAEGKAKLKFIGEFPELVADSKDRMNLQHRYYIDNPMRDADVSVSKKQKVIELGGRIFKMTQAERAEVYQAGYGKNPNDVSPNQISEYLIQKSESEPDQLQAKMADPKLAVKAFIMKLVEAKVFTMEGKKIKQDGKIVGIDIDFAVAWASDAHNADEIEQLKQRLESKK